MKSMRSSNDDLFQSGRGHGTLTSGSATGFLRIGKTDENVLGFLLNNATLTPL